MIQQAQDLLKTSLANCATFRTLVEAANVSEAESRIHHDYAPDAVDGEYSKQDLKGTGVGDGIRPFALIYTQPNAGWKYKRDAAGTYNWGMGGVLVLVLERNYPTDLTSSEADVDFREIAGDIIGELVDQSEGGTDSPRLAVTGFTASGPFRTSPDETEQIGDCQAMVIEIEWGNRL